MNCEEVQQVLPEMADAAEVWNIKLI